MSENKAYKKFIPYDEETAFQEEGRLIQEAFLVSSLIEILTSCQRKDYQPNEIEQERLEDGIKFLQKLGKAEQYISHGSGNMMPQPEGVHVVRSIMEVVKDRVGQCIEISIEALNQAIQTENNVSASLYEEAAAFLRAVHRGITRQLAQISNEFGAF